MTPEYLTAWQEAFEQHGKLLVAVFCGLHGETAGEVRASTAGPVFVTRQVLTPNPQWIQDKVAVRARQGRTPGWADHQLGWLSLRSPGQAGPNASLLS